MLRAIRRKVNSPGGGDASLLLLAVWLRGLLPVQREAFWHRHVSKLRVLDYRLCQESASESIVAHAPIPLEPFGSFVDQAIDAFLRGTFAYGSSRPYFRAIAVIAATVTIMPRDAIAASLVTRRKVGLSSSYAVAARAAR